GAGGLGVGCFARHDRIGWLVVAGVCCGVCWALKSVMGVLLAVGVSGYLAARVAEGGASLRRAFATQAVFLGAAAGVVGITLALLASAGALNDGYLQTILSPKAFDADE